MKKMKRILAMFLAVIMLSMTFTNTAYALTPSIDMVENCSGKKIAQGDKFSLEFEIFTDTTVLYHIELYKGTSTDSDSYIEKLDSDVLGGSLFPQHATVEIDTKKWDWNRVHIHCTIIYFTLRQMRRFLKRQLPFM